MSQEEDRGEVYARSFRVEGEAVLEIGQKDPSGNGYHTIRVPFDEDKVDQQELEQMKKSMKERLLERTSSANENRGHEENQEFFQDINKEVL